MFAHVRPTLAERATACPGDELVHPADVVMDRGFTVSGTPEQVWPWLVQLGKSRAGWYFTRSVERLVPRRNRATRRIEARWQSLAVGDTIPDYGGKHETFLVAAISAARYLVYTSQRGRVRVSWCITLVPIIASDDAVRTRVHLRLRLAPVRRKWLARTAGELIDLVTIAGMAAGLRERLDEYAGAHRTRRGDDPGDR
jgi:hypothetical protein